VQHIRLFQSAYHSVRVIQSKHVLMDGLHIYNRVNNNDDGFHFVSCEYVHVSNCTVLAQDDVCALFGSCRFVTVTNCTFSTRWSVFRFGGGTAENITVSNCVLHQVYGCPFKFHGSPGTRFENMSFSNIVLQDVTGPISISVEGNLKAESVLRVIDSKDVFVTATRVLTPSSAFLQLEGSANQRITIDGGDLSKAAAPVAFRAGATARAVKVRV
jgi:polygalacturonase